MRTHARCLVESCEEPAFRSRLAEEHLSLPAESSSSTTWRIDYRLSTIDYRLASRQSATASQDFVSRMQRACSHVSVGFVFMSAVHAAVHASSPL
jgi:hypothetical protein